MNSIDIKVVELHKQPFKDLQESKLVLEFSGKTVYPSITNSLRRMAQNNVPTYAFCKESIMIEENTSIYDNDYMSLRLEQITIPKVNIPIVTLEDKYWRNTDYSDLNREKHPKDSVNIEFVINYRNDTSDTINLTTNDVKLYQDGEDISDRFDKDFPLLIVKLRKNEIFKCTAKAVLGKGLRNNIWAAAATSYHEYDNLNKIKLTIESQGQLDEYDILYRSCTIAEDKIKNIKKKIEENFNSEEVASQKYLIIKFDRESHTIGEVLNEFLQMNKKVAFSGISKPDLLKDEVVIKMKSIENNPVKPLIKTIEHVINIYNHLKKQFEKLGKKYINL